MEDFQVFYGKILSYDIENISICEGSDLYAYSTDDNTLVLKRISNKPQTISKHEETDKIHSISFNRSGSALAFSTHYNSLKLFSIQSDGLKFVKEIKLDFDSCRILNWKEEREAQPVDLPAEELIPSSEINTTTAHFLKSCKKSSFVVVADSGSRVKILLYGIYEVANLDLASIVPERGIKILGIDFDANMSSMCVGFKSETGSYILRLDTLILDVRHREITEVCYLLTCASEFIQNVTEGIKIVEKDWKTTSNLFKFKFLTGIEDSCESKIQIGCGPKSRAKAQEVLFQCISTGVMTNGLAKFLKDEITSVKSLIQFDDKFKVHIKNLYVTITSKCLAPLERLIYVISSLKSYTEYTEVYSCIGLNITQLKELLIYLQLLFFNLHKLLESLSQTHSYVKNFLYWIQFWTNKLLKEEEANPEANPLDSWKLNIPSLLEFIQSNELLYMLNIDKLLLNYPLEESYTEETACQPAAILKCLERITRKFQAIYSYPSKAISESFESVSILKISNSAPERLLLKCKGNCLYTGMSLDSKIYLLLLDIKDTASDIVSTSVFDLQEKIQHLDFSLKKKNDIFIVSSSASGVKLGCFEIPEEEWKRATNGVMEWSESRKCSYGKQRLFENEEFNMADISTERGLGGLVLNERHVYLIDLEDTEFD